MYIIFWLGNLKGRYHAEDLGIEGKIIFECILEKQSVKLWTGCFWLRIGTGGGFFLTRQ
jgi:hypothetical protein